jgi:MFS family permease
MLTEALFIPFLDNGNKYYTSVFKGVNSSDEAGIYLIMPYCVSSLFVPIMGYFVDKIGRRSIVLIFSCFFYTFTYLFMMFLEANILLR